MIKELSLIKDYVLAEIKKIDADTVFNTKVDSFLQRLIDESEGLLTKDTFMKKAGRQLLCCIGIDIKSGLVPASHYNLIFHQIDFASFSLQARQLFFNAVVDNKLYYRDVMKEITNDYSIVVFPIKDRGYYIDDKITGIHGMATMDLVVDHLIDHLKKNPLNIKDKLLYKGSDLSHFWTTIQSEIEDIRTSSATPARDTADRLGLSHFEFIKDDEIYFCYFDLADAQIETYRPNATLINWMWPDGGFMSYKQDKAGRTFSISGFANYKTGIKERVFNRHHLTDDEHLKTRVVVFEDKIDPAFTVEPDELIQEGLKRFTLA